MSDRLREALRVMKEVREVDNTDSPITYLHDPETGLPYGALVDLELLIKLYETIEDLTDADNCQYDHHNLCQAHNLQERPCPHEVAKELLSTEMAHSHREGDDDEWEE